MTTKYHVCWGPNAVAFVEVPDGSDFQTGQPNDEVFDVRDDAARRAFELNYTGFDHFKLEDEYEDGQYVVFLDNLYRALAEVAPYDPRLRATVDDVGAFLSPLVYRLPPCCDALL